MTMHSNIVTVIYMEDELRGYNWQARMQSKGRTDLAGYQYSISHKNALGVHFEDEGELCYISVIAVQSFTNRDNMN